MSGPTVGVRVVTPDEDAKVVVETASVPSVAVAGVVVKLGIGVAEGVSVNGTDVGEKTIDGVPVSVGGATVTDG